jgi:hypothetical protein
LFGDHEQFVAWVAPADEHHVVIVYVEKDRLPKVVEIVRQGHLNTAANDDVAKIGDLLPPDAMAMACIGPSDMIQFISRIMPAFLPPETGIRLKLPQFPQTLPIVFSISTGHDELQTSTVIPCDVLKAVVPYAQTVEVIHFEGATKDDD